MSLRAIAALTPIVSAAQTEWTLFKGKNKGHKHSTHHEAKEADLNLTPAKQFETDADKQQRLKYLESEISQLKTEVGKALRADDGLTQKNMIQMISQEAEKKDADNQVILIPGEDFESSKVSRRQEPASPSPAKTTASKKKPAKGSNQWTEDSAGWVQSEFGDPAAFQFWVSDPRFAVPQSKAGQWTTTQPPHVDWGHDWGLEPARNPSLIEVESKPKTAVRAQNINQNQLEEISEQSNQEVAQVMNSDSIMGEEEQKPIPAKKMNKWTDDSVMTVQGNGGAQWKLKAIVYQSQVETAAHSNTGFTGNLQTDTPKYPATTWGNSGSPAKGMKTPAYGEGAEAEAHPPKGPTTKPIAAEPKKDEEAESPAKSPEPEVGAAEKEEPKKEEEKKDDDKKKKGKKHDAKKHDESKDSKDSKEDKDEKKDKKKGKKDKKDKKD